MKLGAVTLLDRIHGCLLGIAAGDALGMPALSTLERTIALHGAEISTFIDASTDRLVDPVHYNLSAGEVTDDTYATLAIVQAIIDSGRVDVEAFAKAFINWADDDKKLAARLGRDRGFLGPSSGQAIERLRAGVSPYETGGEGTTNGSAMRVAPIGFVHPGNIVATVDATEMSCIPTHNTNVAISAACAISCAVSVMAAGVTDMADIVAAAKAGAELGATRGKIGYCPSIVKRIDLAVQLTRQNKPHAEIRRDIYDLNGSYLPSYEIVPAAIGAFVLEGGVPEASILSAINVGGDCDTLGAIAGALAGTLRGVNGFPPLYNIQIEAANQFGLRQLSEQFLAAAQRISAA